MNNKRSPRETFDRQLDTLFNQLLVLGSMVEQATLKSIDVLKSRDLDAAQQAYSNDDAINQKRFELENTCITLIALQQPMARDLRILASILDVASELERMGDYAKGIARICILLKDYPPINIPVQIQDMANLTTDMLHRALGAFVTVDVAQALVIPKEDDAVDELYNQITRKFLDIMIADSTMIDRMNYLSWAVHNLERMADRITNICERTAYIATGEMKELDNSDDESE
jgi:phosphate transport system protein